MRIPQDKVDAIYQAADILEVVSDYLPLKKRGANYWGLSPFKAERTPSFAVSAAKGIYKDFSSGKGGNAVNFLMEVEGYSYVEALLHIAKKYGIEVQVQAEGDEAASADDHRSSIFILNKFAAEWFHTQLTATEEGKTVGLAYFKERGLSPQTITTFQLGYSPEGWDSFTKAALAAQYQLAYLLEGGLTVASEQGRNYDRFRGRVIFPIADAAGRMAGFGGRLMAQEAKAAKYLNSPEGPTYDKGAILYGLHLNKQAIRAAGECILVEGYMDLISLYQAGIQHVVASSGTALTPAQLKLLSRTSHKVTLLYDGDEAGTAAALRAINLALEQGFTVQAVRLPPGQDPDSYVRQLGGAAFRNYLATHTEDFLQFQLSLLAQVQPLNHPAQQQQAVQQLAHSVSLLPDEVARSLYSRHAASLLALPEQLFIGAVNKQLLVRKQQQGRGQQAQLAMPPNTGTATVTEPEAIPTGDAPTSTYHQERELVRILLNYPQHTLPFNDQQVAVCQLLDEQLGQVTFSNPTLEVIRQTTFSATRQQEPPPIHALLTQFGGSVNAVVAELLTFPYEVSEHWKELNIHVPPLDADLSLTLASALNHFKLKRLGQLVQENLALLKLATHPDQVQHLQLRHQKLKQIMLEVENNLGVVIRA